MNTEHTEFIIETLNEAVDWFGYVPEYFADKHDLDKDKENIKKSIKLLKDFEHRTCESCRFYHNNTKCIHRDLGMMIPPRGFCCNNWEQK